MSADLAYAGLARQAQLVREGEVTARELVELSLARIERFDPQLNAFAAVYAEQALTQAAAPRPGPLSGVPIAIKDEMDIAGEITSRGTGAITVAAERDAEVVKRLQDAGAIVIGKTKMPRARPVAVHGVDHVGRHPQPVGHGPHAGRLERRVGRRGRRRAGAGRGRRRRRGLDPHPRRLLRAVRPQAAHGPRPAHDRTARTGSASAASRARWPTRG